MNFVCSVNPQWNQLKYHSLIQLKSHKCLQTSIIDCYHKRTVLPVLIIYSSFVKQATLNDVYIYVIIIEDLSSHVSLIQVYHHCLRFLTFDR